MSENREEALIEVFATDAELASLAVGGPNNVANQMLQRSIERGRQLNASQVNTADEDAQKRAAAIAVLSKNDPVLTIDLTDDDVETIADMAIEGKTLNLIAQCVGLNLPQTRIALKNARVTARIDEKTAEMVKASSIKIKTNAMAAVNKLIALMESESDKISIAAAKELVRLAGVGENSAEKEQAKVNDMQAKTTDRLLEIFQQAMGR